MSFTLLGLPFTYPLYLILGLLIFLALNVTDLVLTYAVIKQYGACSQPLLEPHIRKYGLLPTLLVSKCVLLPATALIVGSIDSQWDSGILAILLSWYVYHLLFLREHWLKSPHAVKLAFQRFFHPH